MTNPPYKRLYTYWFSVIIYDLTVLFTVSAIKSYKLREQMDGAARSGKQNILEGSDAMRVSMKSAIKLTGVAKASFEELIGDYEDYLRQRNLERWDKNDDRILTIRKRYAKLVSYLSNLGNLSEEREILGKIIVLPKNPEFSANILLTLCHQATYLLEKQIQGLEKKHEREGGLTEKMYKKRSEYRRKC